MLHPLFKLYMVVPHGTRMDFLAATKHTKTAGCPPNAQTDTATLKSQKAAQAMSAALHESTEKYQALSRQHTALQSEHEKLKKHLSTLSDTVRVLGEQSTQTTKVAQQAQDSKLDLMAKHTKLQEHCNALKSTLETVNRSFEAANEKLFLQNQLHENKLRTIEATHNTLKERCKAMAISTEQHRIANLKLETQNKSMTEDIGKLTQLQSEIAQTKDKEIDSLKARIESHSVETKRLNGKIQAAESLLKAHPVDPAQTAKTRKILASSAEVLQLALKNGGVASMRECLGQVAEVLQDVHKQLGSQHKLSAAWLDRVEKH